MAEPSADDAAEIIGTLNATAGDERALVELVRIDYDTTLRAMSGFVGTGGQIRAIGVAAWGVVVGLAVHDSSALLAMLAAVLVTLFAYADSYHAALYIKALSRAIALERLLDSYLNRLGFDSGDADARLRVRAQLETHRFGMYRTLPSLRFRDLLAARPRAVFRVIYPSLFVVTIALAIAYAS